MEGKDVNDLIRIGKESYQSGKFKEAIEHYKEAVQLDPNCYEIFYRWGNALRKLGENKKNEPLLWEACEKYNKAAQLEPNNADILVNWGVTLYGLYTIKQKESLLKKACKKYDKASQINSNDADIFYDWGNTLYRLGTAKQNKSLLEEACEKYDKALQIKSDDAASFYNWGITLFRLASIKNDESLCLESIDKYCKAIQIRPNDIRAFNNWGHVLCYLAKTKSRRLLVVEEMKKFEKALESINDPKVLLVKGELYFMLHQNDKAIKCFSDSEKDILKILEFLDNENSMKIIQTDILYPLLDSDNWDGRFFKESTKNITCKNGLKEYRNKINNYKKAYISSIFIISQLHIKNENEKFVAHYREKAISQKMLFDDNSNFRLNAIDYSNDLTEGKVLLNYLYGNENRAGKESLNSDYGVFAGCFTFSYDSLNQFRLYGKEDGKEGVGLSLVFKDSFFSKEAKLAMEPDKGKDTNELESHYNSGNDVKQDNDNSNETKSALFRCIYIDPDKQRVVTVGQKEEYLFYQKNNKNSAKKYDEYGKYISTITTNVRKTLKKLKKLVQVLEPKIIEPLLINLRYLTKHVAFKEEQECRIIKIRPLNDKNSGIHLDENYKQLYVKYEPKVSDHIEKIYFGPKAAGMELFQDFLTHKGLNISYERSTNPLS
jgi:tetratricopeptide (TPR) repeat protein